MSTIEPTWIKKKNKNNLILSIIFNVQRLCTGGNKLKEMRACASARKMALMIKIDYRVFAIEAAPEEM